MVDFASIPNTEKVDLLRTISEQVKDYFNDPVNTEKYKTQIKKELVKCSA